MANVTFRELRPGTCEVILRNKRTNKEKSFKGECVILPKSKRKVIYGTFPGDGNWEDVGYKQRALAKGRTNGTKSRTKRRI